MPEKPSELEPSDLGAVRAPTRRRSRIDPRPERTRRRLLDAARLVFERDGYHAARLADVTESASVSTGTFYNYFDCKEALFRAVMEEVVAELSASDHPRRDQPEDRDPVEGIRSANAAYVRGYRKNARLMGLLMQVAEDDAEARELGRSIRSYFEERISRSIERWQAEGRVFADLDPVYAANALAYMVDRFLYEWRALDLTYDEERVVDTLNKLWIRALGLEDGPRVRAGDP